MKVFVPDHSGFCPGVQSAEDRLQKLRRSRPGRPIFILGHLIHNNSYIDYLDSLGIRTIDDPNDAPSDAILVVRTHGLPRQVEAELEARFEVVDLTCFKVKQVQRLVETEAERGRYLFITGSRDHPEVQGILSYAGAATVIENSADLARLVNRFRAAPEWLREAGFAKALILSQTTGDEELLLRVETKLREAAAGYDLLVHNTVCSITGLRQEAAIALLDKTDATLVIGDKLSSNARKLFANLRKRKTDTYFVQTLAEVEAVDWSGRESVQVVSSSSTPRFIEQAVIDYLTKKR